MFFFDLKKELKTSSCLIEAKIVFVEFIFLFSQKCPLNRLEIPQTKNVMSDNKVFNRSIFRKLDKIDHYADSSHLSHKCDYFRLLAD